MAILSFVALQMLAFCSMNFAGHALIFAVETRPLFWSAIFMMLSRESGKCAADIEQMQAYLTDPQFRFLNG